MEFSIDDRAFKADKLSALGQFHLSRKIAPLLPALAPIMIRALEGGMKLNVSDAFEMLGLAGPFAQALADLKEEDAEDIMARTLSSVKVESSPGTWVPLWVAGAKQCSIIELNDFSKLLPIIIRVITFNLENFMAGFLTNRSEADPTSRGGASPVARTG